MSPGFLVKAFLVCLHHACWRLRWNGNRKAVVSLPIDAPFLVTVTGNGHYWEYKLNGKELERDNLDQAG